MDERTNGSARLRLGSIEVDQKSCTLRFGVEAVKLSPRATNVLTYLAEHPGDTVTHEDLLSAFWRGPISSTNAVHKAITELRHALGGFVDPGVQIDTVPKRGYRLLASVSHPESVTGQSRVSQREPHNGIGHELNGNVAPRRRLLFAVAGLVAFGLLATPLVLVALHRTTPTRNALRVNSLAVLRFRDVDPQPDHALLGDAIATALATNLSRAPGLTLVGTDLSFQHSISRETTPQIGAALDARYVLDGTVRTDGTQIHATAVLYDARDGQQIYAYTQDEPLDQIFKLQDKTIADVLSELQIALNDEKSADMRDWGTKNVQAYLTVIDGHAARMRLDPRSIRLAIDRLRDAIRIDPGFVNAYGELAAALADFALPSADPAVTESTRREIANLRKVVMQIDPTSSALPELTMFVAVLGGSPQEIESAARTEIERIGVPSPENSISIYMWYSDVLRRGHLFREAAAYLDLCQGMAPTWPWPSSRKPTLVAMTAGSRQAISAYKRALESFPNSPLLLAGLVLNLGLVGDSQQADHYLARLRQVDEAGPTTFATETDLMILQRQLMADSKELRARLADPRSIDLADAQAHLMVGDVEAGLADLRRMDAVMRRRFYDIWPDIEHWFPKSVIEDPRYQAYLDERGIGRAWTAQLRERAAALTPITGIPVTDSTPQVAVNW